MSDVILDPWFLCLLSGFAGIGALIVGVKAADFIQWIVDLIKWRLGHE